MRRWFILALGALAILTLSACSEDGSEDPIPREQEDLLELTLEELAEYDGQNGNPAYIAVDGKIYDVTNDPNWSGGGHNGFLAGQDLTEEIAAASPHGTSVLAGVPQVGILVESSDPADDPDMNEEPEDEEPVEGTPTLVALTIVELAMYDGSNGAPMYVAYQGDIYDVSDVAAWAGGSHGGVSAGTDVTAELAASPHGASAFTGLTPIGQLVIDSSGEGPYDPYLYLTVLELAEYNGQNGMPAYIAVSGVIYDVSDSSRWSGGSHNGFTAGADLTDEIASISPHGTSVLDRLVIVGELME